MTPQSLLVLSQGWGLIDLLLRAFNEGLLRPRVARAQKIISLHLLLCSRGNENLHTLTARIERPPFSPLYHGRGSGRGCPSLRAWNEHSFTVRVLRARRAPGYSLPYQPIPH